MSCHSSVGATQAPTQDFQSSKSAPLHPAPFYSHSNEFKISPNLPKYFKLHSNGFRFRVKHIKKWKYKHKIIYNNIYLKYTLVSLLGGRLLAARHKKPVTCSTSSTTFLQHKQKHRFNYEIQIPNLSGKFNRKYLFTKKILLAALVDKALHRVGRGRNI